MTLSPSTVARNPMPDPNPNADVLNAALPEDLFPLADDAISLSNSSSSGRSWVPIRRLGRDDGDAVLQHLLSLDADDRRRRFGHLASDEHIRNYVEQLDFERDRVAGVHDRSLKLVAQSHLAFMMDPGAATAPVGTGAETTEVAVGNAARPTSAAEFSVSVLPRSRGQGIGSLLFDHAVTAARNHGVRRLWIHLLKENAAMLAIVQHTGAQIDFEGSEATAQLELPAESLLSRIGERMGAGAAELDYRMKLQSLRLDALRPACR